MINLVVVCIKIECKWGKWEFYIEFNKNLIFFQVLHHFFVVFGLFCLEKSPSGSPRAWSSGSGGLRALDSWKYRAWALSGFPKNVKSPSGFRASGYSTRHYCLVIRTPIYLCFRWFDWKWKWKGSCYWGDFSFNSRFKRFKCLRQH